MRWLLPWCWLVLLACPLLGHAAPLSLFGPPQRYLAAALYQAAPHEPAPATFADIGNWQKSHTTLPRVNMLGGDYWLVAPFTVDANADHWIVAFNNTYYDHAIITLYGDDGLRVTEDFGRFRQENPLLRGAVSASLLPGHHYVALVHVTSRFFSAQPSLKLQSDTDFRSRLIGESTSMLLALGVLLGLGLFLSFVGLWIRDRSYMLYGGQALLLLLGWAFFFGVPQSWLGIDMQPFNFTLWFILLPIAHVNFTTRFLNLWKHARHLAWIGQGIVALSVLGTLVSVLYVPSGLLIAAMLASAAVLFATVTSIRAAWLGARRARFFILAYLTVLIPGLVIFPVTFGLLPSGVDDVGLLMLVGNSCEAMLLAFALADYVKLAEEGRERFRQGMQEAIAKASIDPLTGIGNRLAFNVLIEDITHRQNSDPAMGNWQVAMIDLDGLKRVNDRQGHERGDALLQAVGEGLSQLGERVRAFRLGGDEFALIAFGDELGQQRLSRSLAELDASLRSNGFPDAGISFGLCSASVNQKTLSNADFAELVREADRTMYAHKSHRYANRFEDTQAYEAQRDA